MKKKKDGWHGESSSGHLELKNNVKMCYLPPLVLGVLLLFYFCPLSAQLTINTGSVRPPTHWFARRLIDVIYNGGGGGAAVGTLMELTRCAPVQTWRTLSQG